MIPVRMSEAWLLIDAQAIAKAADSPTSSVSLPQLNKLEQIPDPKQELEHLLISAAGSPTGCRDKIFRRSLAVRRVNLSLLIRDYSPLESLSAFAEFQKALASAYPYTLPSLH